MASFGFMGLATQIGMAYAGANGTEQTYITGSTGDAGDRYAGLDRFSRLVENIWYTPGSEKVHTKYGRNRVGGIVWRRDLIAASFTNDQDIYYHYDALQQVKQYQRGTLTPSSGPYTGITAVANEALGYDSTGNWGSLQTSWNSLLQYRNHNVANQITSTTGPSGVAQVDYDGTGNTVYMPSPNSWTIAHQCRWDPWNRMIELAGTIPTCKYRYDAMHRRIRTSVGSSFIKDFYFDTTWRAIEERTGSAISLLTVSMHYVWSPFDRWTLIRRLDYLASAPNNDLWCLKDGLDPVAIVDTSGTVLNRARYDAFGITTVMGANFGTPVSGPTNWNFFFHGEFQDQETGLYNYGYRYYHPLLGRWLSRDPLGEVGSLNLYQFILNSPSLYYDFLGLDPKPVSGGFGFDIGIEGGWFRKVAGDPSGKDGKNPNVGGGPTGKDMMDFLKKLSDDNCCIKTLTLASHGGTTGLGGAVAGKLSGFVTDPEYSSPNAMINRLNHLQPGDPNYLDPKDSIDENVRTVADLKSEIDKGGIKFCKPCLIQIYGCYQKDLPSALASATGCDVVASSGDKCSGLNDNPNKWTEGFNKTTPSGNVTPLGKNYTPIR